MRRQSESRPRARRPRSWDLLLPLALPLLSAACGGSGGEATGAGAETVEVLRGPLTITVVEGGLLQSGNPVTIRSTIEGRNAILEIVPEGTMVKKGDVVVVLDSAVLQDRLNLQDIDVEKARSELALAEEALGIQAMRNQEEEATARCKRDLAAQAAKAYLEGTVVQERRKLQSAVMLAKEKSARARKQADASRRLVEKQYISRIEVEADEIAEKQAAEEEKLAEGALEQFDTWAARGETLRLETELQVAEIAHKRVLAQCESEATQKKDVRNTALRSYELKVAARDKTVAQIAEGTIRSPADGLVVYAEKDWDEPAISKGCEVREREEIALIPDLSTMVVEVAIHETSVKKIKPGQSAWIKVDAQPDRKLPGTVAQVAVVPATQANRWNPDLKVYKTIVRLDELLDGLKPGMHAEVEILVEEIPDAVHVPVQTIHQSGPRSFVYVAGASGRPEIREVRIGLHGVSRMHVLDGLVPGERVFLAKPAGAPEPPKPPAPEARGAAPVEVGQDSGALGPPSAGSPASRAGDRPAAPPGR